MAEKRRFLDVWLVEANTVYREVPYSVVTDWIQQSRLLADDMLRPSGTRDWFKVGGNPEFAAFLPKAQPFQIEDQAEVLEPVEMEVGWKRTADDEDDDPDMIPLIDISLVLLIFFIMTSVTAPTLSEIETPIALNGLVIDTSDLLVVGVNMDANTREPIYTFGAKRRNKKRQQPGKIEKVPNVPEMRSREEFLQRVEGALAEIPEATTLDISIEAHRKVASVHVREMIAGLNGLAARKSIRFNKYTSVSEPDSPPEPEAEE